MKKDKTHDRGNNNKMKRKMEIVTFKIDPVLLAELDRYAMNKRISRSELIRKAIENLLKDENMLDKFLQQPEGK